MHQAHRRRLHQRVFVTATMALGLTWLATAPGWAGAVPQDAPASRLQQAMQRAIDDFPGRAGVWVHHLESGVQAGVDADTPYPMASTYKVPILVEMMARVEAGEISLDDPMEVLPTDQHIGSGLLQSLWAPGITLSVRNVATMMIILSDNSATDMLIDRLGADRINARLRSLGLQATRVDRTTLELILDFIGVDYAPYAEATGEQINAALDAMPPDAAATAAAEEAFYADGKDVATAREMTALLTMIASSEGVAESSSRTILEILERTQTGEARLKGLLPAGTVVAHKTGTIGRVVNDVGILYLPGDAGRVSISVYTLGATGTDTARSERLIADLARTAYDYFLLTPLESQ